jgi:hypothetical protein
LRQTARLDDSYKIIKMAVLHPAVLIGTETSFAAKNDGDVKLSSC